MRFPNSLKVLTLTILGILIVPAFLPATPTANPRPFMASYNPAPADSFHAPLSSMALAAITGATPNVQSLTSSDSQSNMASNPKTIQQNALRFIIDDSYFPQSETTIAVDPNNPHHVVGGFNDAKYFFCSFLPADCGSSVPVSLSGFTVSIDGGASVSKSSNIPILNATNRLLTPWGDPSVAASVDGNFFYATIVTTPGSSLFGEAIMIAKSNPNLFDPNVSCTTSISNPLANSCWKDALVNGTIRFPNYSFEDKDRIAVDRDLSSPYYGSVYVGWDHFYSGVSTSDLARCDGNLVHCTMVSGGDQPVASGSDPYVSWTTPVVDKNGNVYVAWCNFGTIRTLGPVSCRISSSPPGGARFSAPVDILSYMGAGTTLPTDTVILGWATEQFRIAAGLISIAVDLSSKSNNIFFTTPVCASRHYYKIPWLYAPVAVDNPGSCGQSAVLISKSTDGGSSWSSPAILSNPAVNDQPFATVDPQTGTLYVVYYTTQYDSFNHRIDVVASVSNNAGVSFHQQRVTSVSNEPDSDPAMYDYIVRSNPFGGSFVVPQYGDYFEATAIGGKLWVLFTGNYAVEAGTFQTDPFLAVL